MTVESKDKPELEIGHSTRKGGNTPARGVSHPRKQHLIPYSHYTL